MTVQRHSHPGKKATSQFTPPSFWVNASAGTGKTTVLVEQVLRLLLGGAKVGHILCLTYTRAAAAQMKIRITQKLSAWVALPPDALYREIAAILPDAEIDDEILARARNLFLDCLDAPDGLRIQTLHSFCQSILQRFPLEAGIAPNMRVLEERQGPELQRQAFERTLSRIESDEILRSALSVLDPMLASEEALHSLLRNILKKRHVIKASLARHGTIDGVMRHAAKTLELPWPFNTEMLWQNGVKEQDLRKACAVLSEGSKTEQARALIVQRWLDSDPATRCASIEEYKMAFLKKEGGALASTKLANKKSIEKYPAILDVLLREALRLEQIEEKISLGKVIDCTQAVYRLGLAGIQEYEFLKTTSQFLDYDDLIDYCLRLLRKPGIGPWVLFKLDGGLRHILLDEAQDTSPKQWEILRHLTEEFFSGQGLYQDGCSLFVVGDPKQSIYSFQDADPRKFTSMQNYFRKSFFDSKQEFHILPLHDSYRSVPEILRCVDVLFSNTPARQGVLYFNAMEKHKKIHLGENSIHHGCIRNKQSGTVEIWPLVCGKKAAEEPGWQAPEDPDYGQSAESRLAGAIANKVAELISGAEFLSSHLFAGRDSPRAIEPKDIMILLRQRSGSLIAELVRALKNRNIPVSGIDRLSLPEHIAIQDLIALGRFLCLPEDDYSLACYLKSPLSGIPPEDAEQLLFDLCYDRKELSLWQNLQLQARKRPAIAETVDKLSRLLQSARTSNAGELYYFITYGLGGIKAMQERFGPECIDPVEEFLDLCLSASYKLSNLDEFLEWFDEQEIEIKREFSDNTSNQVRIMTVHAAKGLQAPVVFLPDTTKLPFSNKDFEDLLQDPVQDLAFWAPRKSLRCGRLLELHQALAEDRFEEYNRLLYVALTRAEDRLYICGYGEAKPGSWYDNIVRLIGEIPESEWRKTNHSFDKEWSGEIYTLGHPQENIERFFPSKIASAEKQALPEWAWRAPKWLDQDPAKLDSLRAPRPNIPLPDRNNAASMRHGRLIHRLLQNLPDLPLDKRHDAMQRFLSQPGHGLSASQRENIVKEVIRLIEDPRFALYFSKDARAEVPIIGIAGPFQVQGRIDRLYMDNSEIKFVDFKTGSFVPDSPAEIPEAYLRQLALYRVLLQKSYPTHKIEAALLWTSRPKMLIVPESALTLL